MSKKLHASVSASNARLEKRFGERLNDKYEDDFPERAYKMLKDGKTQAAIAADFGVTVKTIQRWKQPTLSNGKPNPHFREEFAWWYLLGIPAQYSWWDDIARDNAMNPNGHFNPALYFGERKRLHHYSEERTIKVPELLSTQDFAERITALTNKVASGEITPTEYQKVVTALAKCHDILEFEKLKEEVRVLKEAQNGNT